MDSEDATKPPARRSPAPKLSLVIPAFNEAARIGATLAAAAAYLATLPYETELVLVDDGSSDATASIASDIARGQPGIEILTVPHAGKAAAVRAGMRHASGDLIAFTDADLATPLPYLEEFVSAVEAGHEVVIGSREGTESRRIGEPAYRHVMGRVFNRVVQLLLLPGFDDTQCGFKLFSREAALDILDRSRLYAEATPVIGARVTAFDVEMLVIARVRGHRILARPVVWTYGSRSTVDPVRDTINNLLDIARVYLNLRKNRYK